MAVKLFLNDTEVITDSAQEIRITRENPYITLSDSYTLDVSLPLDILQNRRFFGNLQRIDTSKHYREFACRLLCGNALLMEGTARIVQSTDLVVKVQLACGVSALKMSSEQEEAYIDRLVTERTGYVHPLPGFIDPGEVTGSNHLGFAPVILDSTQGMTVNLGSRPFGSSRSFPYVSECPRLTDVARLVAARLGYDIDLSYLPEACSHIYVMSAIQGSIGKKLPHWTVKEFFTEFQNFFGCTFVRSGEGVLRLVPLSSYGDGEVTEITPAEEFQVEFSEEDEAEGIINRNVEFSMEGADLEVVDEEVLAQARYQDEYSDAGGMENAFRSASDEIRMHKLYRLNGETYIGWATPGEGEGDAATYELRRVAPFNPLRRFEGAESVALKIAPAYMEETECTVCEPLPLMVGTMEYGFSAFLPSVPNPYGLTQNYSPAADEDSEGEPPATLQELVEGTESVAGEEDKPDIMSVAFIDGGQETVTARLKVDAAQTRSYKMHLAFTDYSLKRQFANNRRKWSFSLNPLEGYDFYLGQLHRIPFTCSHRVKHVVKFLSNSIPDPSGIFQIRGKRFACEKIEASIRDGQLDPLMTGYFYEFLS